MKKRLFLQIAIGIEQGVRPLISYNYNAALGKRTKSLINGSMVVMGIYTLACFCFVMLFPNAMVRLFLPIADVMPVVVGFLRIYIFSIFGIGFLELFNAIFQAMGQWKTATVGIVIGKIVLMVPALLIFSKIWNVTGIIAAQPFAETYIYRFHCVAGYFYKRIVLKEVIRMMEKRYLGNVEVYAIGMGYTLFNTGWNYGSGWIVRGILRWKKIL